MQDEKTVNGVRNSCHIASDVMQQISKSITIGMSTLDVDKLAAETMKDMGVRSAFLGYHGFPGHICISLNEEVLHGIPSACRLISAGDLVKVDLGVVLDGYYSDTAKTFLMEDNQSDLTHKKKLMDATLSALMSGISAAKAGHQVKAIASAIHNSLNNSGYEPVDNMSGHGVGIMLHQPPQVPNKVEGWDCNSLLTVGMTIAIEPMVGAGTSRIRIKNDGWTIVMEDHMPSAHFEHTVLITDGEPEILT